jgi:formylglycine-generating enzyme required for sulfatase activity
MENYKSNKRYLWVELVLVLITIFTTTSILGQQKATDSTKLTWTNRIGMEFRLIQPGSMMVGRVELECPDPPDTRDVDEKVRWTQEDFKRCQSLAKSHSRPGFMVTMEKPYYMGKYEVTQGQWKKVMGANPSFFQGDKIEGESGQHPVENVTWSQAQAFIKNLNSLDSTAKYRLPTEFEWEYAARAGNEELLSWSETRVRAWIQNTNKGSTRSVGQMKPNAWGLYDMLGNVWEWVADYYNNKTFPDPVPPESGDVHVLRGGSFISDVANATYFYHAGGPGNGYDVGFRIVREVK